MNTDNAPALISDPGAFIANHTIALSEINVNMPQGTWLPNTNNQQCRLTLSQSGFIKKGVPMLRMLPGLFGGSLKAIPAYYLHAGDGGMAFNVHRHVDLPLIPHPPYPRFLFTTGMNGCSLIVTSVVPGGAPPLPANHYRVFHDHDHRPLATWHTAGYTVRFASYADITQAGPIPPAFAANINVTTYNPNNYPWSYVVHGQHGVTMRVVTNFLHYNGGWHFHSCHFHDRAGVPNAVDTPPGVAPAASSTQSLPM